MTQHKAIVQKVFDGWAVGNFRVTDEAIDDHVVLVLQPEFPDSGAYYGRDAVAQYTRRFLEPWEQITITATDIRSIGDTVLASVSQQGTGVTSGISVDLSYYMLFTLRGDKIVRLESIKEEADALDAAGSNIN